MNALIPHKDTLLFLYKVQKEIIQQIEKEKLIYPQFPLYCLQENEIPNEIISFTIFKPKTKKEFAIFPIEIECKKNKLNFFIVFAKTSDNSPMPELTISKEFEDAFPKKEHIFRIANIIHHENSWQIFDDKWVKIK